MTKRNARNRRHGTNEMAADAGRKKGRLSPTVASENVEYTMIDLVRSVEKLHLCKNGERKDTVMWADVKKYYKKQTGRVLSTEVFNKLAGVTGSSRKELIAGPLAGLLVAEDPSALVLRFKYDANKGDPLINHRFYLEATGAKTSVHHANAASPRLVDVTNMVSPSRSETSSSLSPACLSSISTDPDTEALSPISAASPSSTPISPRTCEYATANDDERAAEGGDTSFLTARTSPIASDWSSSSSRADTESPQNRSGEEDKTFNLLDVSSDAADVTVRATETVVLEMDAPSLKKEEEEVEVPVVVKGEEEKREEERKDETKENGEIEEDGSDKENHVESQQAKPVESTPPPSDAAAEDVVVVEKKEEEEAVEKADDVIDEKEVKEAEDEKETKEEEVVEESPALPETAPPAPEVEEKEEEKKMEEETEEKPDPAAGDAAHPVPSSPSPLDEPVVPPPSLPSAALNATSPVTASSSDETLLTVIERPLSTVAPTEEEDENVEWLVQPPPPVQPETTKEEMEKREEEKKEEEEEVVVVEKREELAAAAPVEEPAEPPKEEDEEEEKAVVGEVSSVEVKETTKGEEKREERVEEEVKQIEPVVDEVAQPEEKPEAPPVETAEPIEPAPEPVVAAIPTEENSSTEEPTATTMVSAAAVAPLQEEQKEQPLPTATCPAPAAPPLATHEPMTSDDVDMHDILAGGPRADVHTPSVTAPITLQPKPAKEQSDEESEVITRQPVVDETDATPHAAVAAASPKDDVTASSPDDLALRRAEPAKKFPCCTIV